VKKKLGLPNHSRGAGQAVKPVEQFDGLIGCERKPGLPPFTEGGIRDEHIAGRGGRKRLVTKPDPWRLRVGKNIAEQIRTGWIADI